MKFLRYFEDVQVDWHNKNYKAGDYILVNSKHNNIYNTFMVIDMETDEDIFACHFALDKTNDAEIFISEIVRKLTQDEIDALKFKI